MLRIILHVKLSYVEAMSNAYPSSDALKLLQRIKTIRAQSMTNLTMVRKIVRGVEISCVARGCLTRSITVDSSRIAVLSLKLIWCGPWS